MRKGVIAAGVIITILLVIWLTPRRTTIGDKTFQLKAPSSSTAGSSNYPASPVGQSKYPQIDPRSLSTEQIAAEVKRRDSEDAKWEWKVPIRFFGRTVDERLLPVAGAEIHFQWTDLSNHGTSQTTGSSDDRGFFSLSNIHGKRLVIRVRKDGYYSSDQENQVSFEFANPFEETYYQANPDNPVLFQLRKKGQGTESQKKSVEVVLPGDGS